MLNKNLLSAFFTLTLLIPLVGCKKEAPRFDQSYISGREGDIKLMEDLGYPSRRVASVKPQRVSPTSNEGFSFIPDEARLCGFELKGKKFDYSHPIIGEFSICRPSKVKDRVVFIQLKTLKSENRLCFIPTTKHDEKTDKYIGEQRCIFITKPGNIYRVEFLKNRPGEGWKTTPLTGVMVLKDQAYQYPKPFPEKEIYAPDAYQKYCQRNLDMNMTEFCKAFVSLDKHFHVRF